jgi:glycosyltransferase involved in cell wall biosynthesis
MYVGKMAEVLANHGRDVSVVFHSERFPGTKLAEIYGLDLSGINFRHVAAAETSRRERPGPLARFFARSPERKDLSEPYELFIYSTSGEVPPISHAARAVLVVYFPCVSYEEHHGYTTEAWRNQPAPVRALRRYYHAWKWKRVFDSYHMVITISQFTREWVRRRWGVESKVVFPPARIGSPTAVAKQPRILTLGRFMADKKHDALIACFKQMCDQGLQGWRLALLGGSPRQGEADPYLSALRDSARGYPIDILTDLPGHELDRHMAEASLFWHAKGYGEDVESNPQEFEHFGIATIEAMAAGCVPLVYRGGGQVEIVRDGTDGLLWETADELVEHTWSLIRDGQRREEFARSATGRAEAFSGRAFEESFLETIAPMLSSGSFDRAEQGKTRDPRMSDNKKRTSLKEMRPT